METIFDLPAHPLFVHLPIVLLPIAALASVALLFRPQWRRPASPALVAVTVVTAISAVMAARSGDKLNNALRDRIGDVAAEHKELGETTVWLTLAFLVGTVGVLALQRVARFRDQRQLNSFTLVATSVLGLLATIWMIRTGHEGATIVWDGVLPE